jgi:ATP-dependent DNA helicase RecQ
MPIEKSLALSCLCLDLEVDPRTKQILKIGAFRPGTNASLTFSGKFNLADALEKLDALAVGASFILGHNVVRHDLNLLKALAPGLNLLKLPAIDTLNLSPLAFPRNPYHHLVKDYRLLKLAVNDPLSDARLTVELFLDQEAALRNEKIDLVRSYYYLLSQEETDSGLSILFAFLTKSARPDRGDVKASLHRILDGHVCRQRLESLLDFDIDNPSSRPAIAYLLAWIQVAEGKSIIPPWVRLEYPVIKKFVLELRSTPCKEVSCTWCRENHDIKSWLKRWFGYDDFRRDENGFSLQDDIVTAGLAAKSLLGILPTGGGKSLCYQLPALMHYNQTSALTIVISPLQALMKDQVDTLLNRGISGASTLNGSLSLPERKQVLDGIRLGDVGILLVSPEQVRNKGFRDAIKYREIAAWVFDEAHCLSKWGHDFRPDYIYVSRFIRELHGEVIPPVMCLTATAKPDVIEDIVNHFRQRLGLIIELHLGSTDRSNLKFSIVPTRDEAKLPQIHQLLSDQFGEPNEERSAKRLNEGGAIVYCATRKNTQEIADYLAQMGWAIAAYHAGLPPDIKKERQQDFIAGNLKVITATNAFGMGIDKSDVRLVIHADIPGSLENYIQEAGRAGRDQESANCILFYSEKDAERQFSMTMNNRLTPKDIQNLLHALRRRQADKEGNVVMTVGDLLATDNLELDFNPSDRGRDTRVKTAVAWLENAELLERNENRTQVFPASLRFKDIEEAKIKLASSNYSALRQSQLLKLLITILQTDPKDGLSTDDLSVASDLPPREVGRALLDLETMGLIENDSRIVMYLRVGIQGSSQQTLDSLNRLETALLDELRESAPDAALESAPMLLTLPALTQKLKDKGFADVLPEHISKLLETLRQDGRDLPGGRSSFELRRLDKQTYQVMVQRQWSEIETLSRLRRDCAQVLLAAFLQRLPTGLRGKDLQVDVTLGQISSALKGDLAIAPVLKDVASAVLTSLLYLNTHGVLTLAQGLSIFSSAMTLKLYPEERKRGFAGHDYQPLADHYAQRVSQIHVMIRYAEIGIGKEAEALKLVSDYFTMREDAFLARYFAEDKEMLDRATTEVSWHKISDGLSPIQRRIVTEKRPQNRLVLAGPGSGKTRLIVHRVAFLVRVLRERPESILVVTFNRHAAMDIRRRLHKLIDTDSFKVAIHTYHGLALRLSGVSLANRDSDLQIDFNQMLVDATRLLKGESVADWEVQDTLRDRLLAGSRWLLVDEYQDINSPQYEFLSALAGRTLKDKEGKLNLLAVGDDDQNIYEFAGAQVEFIRRFENDYDTKIDYLVENFRSTTNIIAVANALIDVHPERLKLNHPITINANRRKDPAGGKWSRHDAAVSEGRVQILDAGSDYKRQGWIAIQELLRLANLDEGWDWSGVAVIAKEWKALSPVRAACELVNIPCYFANSRKHGPVNSRIREVARFLRLLDQHRGDLMTMPQVKLEAANLMRIGDDSPGNKLVLEFLDDFDSSYGDGPHPIPMVLDAAYGFLSEADHRYGNGICLTTAHGAKGLEFDHVIVLDGSWHTVGQESIADRRLYYVALTRARQTLALCRMNGKSFTSELSRLPEVLTRQTLKLDELPLGLSRHFKLLHLGEVDMDFSGRSRDVSMHKAISDLKYGDELVVEYLESQNRWTIKTVAGQIVGRTTQKIDMPPGKIIAARVAAISVRRSQDQAENSPFYIKIPEWEVVLPELVIES